MASYARFQCTNDALHQPGGVALWSAASARSCEPNAPRAASLLNLGWRVELVWKPCPLAHHNPFELRSGLSLFLRNLTGLTARLKVWSGPPAARALNLLACRGLA